LIAFTILEIKINKPMTILSMSRCLLMFVSVYADSGKGMSVMIKEQALQVLRRLEEAGFEAFFVGGCVRDWLLGRTVHDIDICTNAHPSDIMQLFPRHYPTGLQHGTISVREGSEIFEVTTYRTEGKYDDYRRPSEVAFVTDIRQDLARRDFTINAMAMDLKGRIVDPFDGRRDLRDRVIRAVGDADTRFQEDALRLVRAVRFAAGLGFQIEARTYQALGIHAPLLKNIAVERIRDELTKLVDSSFPDEGCRLLDETNLLGSLPRIAEVFHQGKAQAWRLPRLGSFLQKWSLLYYAAGQTDESARQAAAALRMSKRERETITAFVSILHELSPAWDRPRPIDWGKLLLRYGWDFCVQVDMLLQAIWCRQNNRESTRTLIETYERMPVKSLGELAVTGSELQRALRREPGSWIGRVLQSLYEQTALHGLPNTYQALIEAAKKEVEADEDQAGDIKGV
jgi:tRNA nucleotidyltransferase (CCA-adding enzyme)